MPMSPALAIERSRLTIVETAITWSGSVACRIPRKNPMVRMASPLVKQAHLFSEFQGPAHRSITEMEETLRGKMDAAGVYSSRKDRMSSVGACGGGAPPPPTEEKGRGVFIFPPFY